MPLTPDAKLAIEQSIEVLVKVAQDGGTSLASASVAHDALQVWLDTSNRLSLQRNASIRQALLDGYSFTDIGRALGLSRQRVQQLAEMPPGPPGRRPTNPLRDAEVADLTVQRSGFTLQLRGRVEYRNDGQSAVVHLDDGGTLGWHRLDGGAVVLDEGEAFQVQVEYRPGAGD